MASRDGSNQNSDAYSNYNLKAGLTIGGTTPGQWCLPRYFFQSDCAPRLGSIRNGSKLERLESSVINTHFLQRGRHGRLLSTLQPASIRYWEIDEQAAVIPGRQIEVIGEGSDGYLCQNSMHQPALH